MHRISFVVLAGRYTGGGIAWHSADVSEAVADMQTTGEPVPKPLAERYYSGEFRVRIPLEVHRALALQAAEQGNQPEPLGQRQAGWLRWGKRLAMRARH